MIKVKDLVKGNTVRFVRYHHKRLIYVIVENGFEFGVPVSDTGDGIFKAEDRAMTYMRWIRKQAELINEARDTQNKIIGTIDA